MLTQRVLLCSLTDQPEANDTITLFVTAFGLEGNTIDVEPLLQYDKGVHNLTHANYGHQYQTRINVTGLHLSAAPFCRTPPTPASLDSGRGRLMCGKEVVPTCQEWQHAQGCCPRTSEAAL